MGLFSLQLDTLLALQAWDQTGPVLTSFSPLSATGGSPLSLVGAGFTGATSVRFGTGVQAAPIVNSDASVSVTVPTGTTATLNGPLSITTPAGTATSSQSFTLAAPPSGIDQNVTGVINSIMQGKPSDPVTDQGTSFFDRCAALLPASYRFNNKGIAGESISNVDTDAEGAARTADIDATLDPAAGVTNTLVIIEYSNSGYGPNALSAADYFQRLRAWTLARYAAGWDKIIQVTTPPRATIHKDGTVNQAAIDFNAQAQIVNSALLDAANADISDDVLNLQLNSRAGRFEPSAYNEDRNSFDGLHPRPEVHTIMAYMLRDSLNYLALGAVKPDPTNYPPTQILPGEDVVWNVNSNAVVEGNTFYSVIGSPQYGGYVQDTTHRYPAKDGLCAFAEMTFNKDSPGFFALCKGAPSSLGAIEQAMYFGGGGGNPWLIHIWSDGGQGPQAVSECGEGDRLGIYIYRDQGSHQVIFYRNSRPICTLTKTVQFPVGPAGVTTGGAKGRETAAINCKCGAG